MGSFPQLPPSLSTVRSLLDVNHTSDSAKEVRVRHLSAASSILNSRPNHQGTNLKVLVSYLGECVGSPTGSGEIAAITAPELQAAS